MSTEQAPVFLSIDLSDRAVLEKPVGKVKKASNDADLNSMILLRFSLAGQLVTLNGFIARPRGSWSSNDVKGSRSN